MRFSGSTIYQIRIRTDRILRKRYIDLLALSFITAILLFIFYGKIITSPQHVFFANWGDGIKNAYGSYYHFKYDSSYMHTYSMNYPYGESVFFTGNQAVFVNPLKAITGSNEQVAENLLGILNIWMIFSILLGIVCIYLLLRELKLPMYYSMIASLIIGFLSPQIERFSGHYDLAYLWVMPLLLLMLLRYYKKPGWQSAAYTGLISFIALYIHGYFFAFYCIWVFFMLLMLLFTEKSRFPAWKSGLHILIMVGIPALIFSLITADPVSDRTLYPWGGIESAANPEGIFLPVYTDYGSFLEWRKGVGYYIGMTSTFIFLGLLAHYIIRLRKRNEWLCFYKNRFLNALLLGSGIALIFSMAYPFKLYFERIDLYLGCLLNYTGPLRQFRGMGRFSWMFFYTINLVSFHFLYHWYEANKNRFRLYALIAVMLIGIFEAFMNIKDRGTQFNKRVGPLADIENNNPENQWVRNIDANDYQAIVPLPYFHIGSENFWIAQNEDVSSSFAFVASWKSGLPLMAVKLSRTSMGQTIRSIGLVMEPLSPFKVVGDLPNRKDILVLRVNTCRLSENENRILSYADSVVYRDKQKTFYRLPVSNLERLQQEYMDSLIERTERMTSQYNVFAGSGDSTRGFIYNSFGNSLPEPDHGKNVRQFKARKKTVLLNQALFPHTDSLSVSLWLQGMQEDMIPRTRIELKIIRRDGSLRILEFMFSKKVVAIDPEGWGLAEYIFKPSEADARLIITAYNPLTTSQKIRFDDILIRSVKEDICLKGEDFWYLNNRYTKKTSGH